MESNFSIAGLYLNKHKAEAARDLLQRSGFKLIDLSILAPNKSSPGKKDFVYLQKTNILKASLVGAILGFFIIGIITFFAGLGEEARQLVEGTKAEISNFNQGVLVTPQISMLFGLLFGAVCGAFVGIGIPQSVGKRFGFYLKEGGYVLTIHIKNKEQDELATKLLANTGAQDVSKLQGSDVRETIIPEKIQLIQNSNKSSEISL